MRIVDVPTLAQPWVTLADYLTLAFEYAPSLRLGLGFVPADASPLQKPLSHGAGSNTRSALADAVT